MCLCCVKAAPCFFPAVALLPMLRQGTHGAKMLLLVHGSFKWRFIKSGEKEYLENGKSYFIFIGIPDRFLFHKKDS